MQLYLDMDGVLADFDAGYAAAFGRRPDKAKDDVDWDAVRAYPDFYLHLPPMADVDVPWSYVERYQPIVLTGVPRIPEAAANKRAWAARWLPGTLVVATRSSEKAAVARPGDVLVDDWTRYRDKWEAAGGVWVAHTSALDTVRQLREMGL